MDLRDIRIEPDQGLFDQISRRLARRRMWRWSGVAATVVAVGGLGLWLLLDRAAPDTPSVTPASTPTSTLVATAAEQEATSVATTQTAEAVEATVAVQPRQARAAQAEAIAPMEYTQVAVGMDHTPALASNTIKPVGTSLDELILDEENRNILAEVASITTTARDDASPVTAVPAKDGPSTHVYDNVFTAPNIILPQGDVDENRRFKLQASSAVSGFHMAIYNRGGRMVFSSDNIDQSWDGTYQGNHVSQGTYVWMATFRDTDGNPHREHGTITVVY